jgi:HPt (histidine-containing phosphotransfer) domain-containing protein
MAVLVDFHRFRSFTDGNPALEAELANLFIQTAGTYLDKLSTNQDERAAWRPTIHALKGAASNIGAVALAELASTAERMTPDARLLLELREAFNATRAAFETTVKL